LLCSYGYRRPPYGVRACVSRDQGLAWDIEQEIVLRDDGGSRDVGYPSSAQLADGTIVTVYYIHGPDGIRHIAATRWRLD
jgi:sialidase-1